MLWRNGLAVTQHRYRALQINKVHKIIVDIYQISFTMIGMTGYTKLFGSIVASTIWREDNDTRIVWITMLALANKDGIVEASIPGLADLSRVSVDKCRIAITKLESPDEDSRTKENEGRRIRPVDGGWLLLNHAKYRAKLNADERREYFRIKKQEQRSVSNNVQQCPTDSTPSTQAEAEAEAEAEENTYTQALEIYSAYPLHVGKPDALKSIRRALLKIPYQKLLKLTKDYAARRNGDLSFTPHPSTWFNQERYNDDPATWTKIEPQSDEEKKRIKGMLSKL